MSHHLCKSFGFRVALLVMSLTATAYAQQKIPDPLDISEKFKKQSDTESGSGTLKALPAQKLFGEEKAKPPYYYKELIRPVAQCSAFSGSADDLKVVRATVLRVVSQRGYTKEMMDSLTPHNCPGQEWDFYLHLLVRFGKGAL